MTQMITCGVCKGTGNLGCHCAACGNNHRYKCDGCKGQGEVRLSSLGKLSSDVGLVAAADSARNARTDAIAEDFMVVPNAPYPTYMKKAKDA